MGVLRAECNEFLVTNVVKILSSRIFPAYSQIGTCVCMCVWVCMCVRVCALRWTKSRADIWYACVLYHSWHEPKKVSIANSPPFWSMSAILYLAKKKLIQKCNEGCQLEQFTDPALYFPHFCTHCSCVLTTSKRSMHWENENIYLIFFYTISHYIMIHLVTINCMPVVSVIVNSHKTNTFH